MNYILRLRPSEIFDYTFFYEISFGLINFCENTENSRNRKILTTQNLSTLSNQFCQASLTNFHLNYLKKESFPDFVDLFSTNIFPRNIINKDSWKRDLVQKIYKYQSAKFISWNLQSFCIRKTYSLKLFHRSKIKK